MATKKALLGAQGLDANGQPIVNASNITASNTITAQTFSGSGASLTNIPNSALNNSSITINSTPVSLGGSITVSATDSSKLPLAGGTLTGSLSGTSASFSSSVTASSLIKSGGISSQFLKADGSVDANTYYLASNPSGYITSSATITGDARNITQYAINQNLSTTSSPTFGGLTVDTNTLFVDATNDRVGVGTVSPSTKLDVNGGDLLVDASSVGDERGIFFRRGFTSTDKYNVSILVKDHDGNFPDGLSINAYDGISFCTGSNTRNERMRLNVNGNLGLSTTNPVYKMQIEPTSVTAGGVNNLLRIGTQSTTTGTTSRFSMFCSTDPVNDTNGGKVFIDAIRTATNMDLAFSLNNTGGASPVERMRLTGEGNLGLGTISPQAKLNTLESSNSIVWSAIFQNSSNAISGNAVGIKFKISDFSTTAETTKWVGISSVGIGANYNDYMGLAFYTKNGSGVTPVETMRLDHLGNLGIGTVSPAYKLDVNGTLNTSGAITQSGNQVLHAGNVNTYSPTRFTTTIDASALNQSTFYPVIMFPAQGRQLKVRVKNILNSNVPSWSTHPSGFTFVLDYEVNGHGWGTVVINRKIFNYSEGYTSARICGGIGQLGNGSAEYVMVRGGGIYYFEVDDSNCTPALYSSGYSYAGQSINPTTSTINDIWNSSAGTYLGVQAIYLPSYDGIYTQNNNGASFRPNDGTYGSWKIGGSRNGWNGIEFETTSNGTVSLMVQPNANTTGFYNNSAGWQFRWNVGTLYCHKGTYGGGTEATVLDSSNYSSYSVVAYGTSNDNIDADWGQSFKTFDPVPSGTPPISSPNIRTINIGNSYGRRTQLAFTYDTDRAFLRRRTDSSWSNWVEFLTTSNYSSYAIPNSGSWLGDLGSYGFTRYAGMSMSGGAEVSFLYKGGQGYTLVDGSYYAFEGGGFYSSSNSSGGTLIGMKAIATNVLELNAKTSIRRSVYSVGANDFFMELTAPDDGSGSGEIGLRFHLENRYWRQIRANSGGFVFTQGGDNNTVPITASNVIAQNEVSATNGMTHYGGNRIPRTIVSTSTPGGTINDGDVWLQY